MTVKIKTKNQQQYIQLSCHHTDKHVWLVQLANPINSPFPLLLRLFLCFLFSIGYFFFVFCFFGLNVLGKGSESILVLSDNVGINI